MQKGESKHGLSVLRTAVLVVPRIASYCTVPFVVLALPLWPFVAAVFSNLFNFRKFPFDSQVQCNPDMLQVQVQVKLRLRCFEGKQTIWPSTVRGTILLFAQHKTHESARTPRPDLVAPPLCAHIL